MKIVTVMFPDGQGHGDWERMCDAWEASALVNCPGAEVEIVEIDRRPDKRPSIQQTWADNTLKLAEWIAAAEDTQDDLVLMDCDTLVLGDLSEAFAKHPKFDVAYTIRGQRHQSHWLNAGVVFVRPNERSLGFLRRWREVNDELMADDRRLGKAIQRHIGINQTALVHLLDNPPDARLKQLPCAVWNNVEQTWGQFGPDTKVLHLKTALRELALADAPIHRWPQHMRPMRQAWLRYDKMAKALAQKGGGA